MIYYCKYICQPEVHAPLTSGELAGQLHCRPPSTSTQEASGSAHAVSVVHGECRTEIIQAINQDANGLHM